MKKINLLILCTLLYSASTTADNSKIFQEVRNGDKEAIRKRLDNGEDYTVRDENGNTVLHIAAQEGQKEIIDIITEYFNTCSYYTYYTSYTKTPNLDEVNDDGDTVLHAAINGENNHEDRIQAAEYVIKKQPKLMRKYNKKNFSPAFSAAYKDDPRFIRVLAAHELNIDNHTRNGETICTYSIKEKKLKTIQYCAQKTELGNVLNNDGKAPIMLIIDTENIPLLELFKNYLNTHIANSDIKPIHYAAANGKDKIVDYIFNNNVSIDEPDKNGNPPLFHAIINNNEQTFNHLIYLGADLKKRNKQGKDALAFAAHYNHRHLMNVLVKKHNVDVNERDENGRTAFMRAAIEQNHAAMKELLTLDANSGITDNNRKNSLHEAARNGDQQGASIILNSDKSLLKGISKDGNTPMLTACQNNQLILAKMLLDAGSPIDTINNNGETIIHETAKKYNSPFLTELLKKAHPQLINHKNIYGETAIFFSAQHNDVASIKELIKANAEYHRITNIHGLTPILYAAGFNAVEAMQELERQGASLSICTPEGNNAAHIAAGRGKMKSLKYLQTKNGLCNERNKKGETPFSYAALEGQLEATKMLLREEYYINGDFSRTMNSLKNSPTRNNRDVLEFLTKEHTNRLSKCQEIYNVYVQTNNIINENQRSIGLLPENNFFRLFTYSPSQLERTTVDNLYHMTEAQRTKLSNDYWKFKDKERTNQINFEREIANNRLEKQNAIAREQAEKERIRKQQQDELDRIAEQNRQRAAQEQARLKQELEHQNRQTEPERIATQQGTTIAQQKAELDRLAAEKYKADIVAHHKQLDEEKARAKQARKTERARIEAERIAKGQNQQPVVYINGQPIPKEQFNYPVQEDEEEAIITETGECDLCTKTVSVSPYRCTNCKTKDPRVCDACIAQWITRQKTNHLPLTCPNCNEPTLSEKLKK